MSREYYLRNKECLNRAKKERYRQNRAAHCAASKRYVLANKEVVAARQAEWRKKNRKKLWAYGRKYYAENAERLKGEVHRRSTATLEARLLATCRKRISGFIRRKEGRPGTRELLGCTLPEFRDYLEKRFPKGCTWENYGSEWHIDHIIPCAAFDLQDAKQLRQCFHFTNLRPLRASVNLRKHDKITEPQLKLLL